MTSQTELSHILTLHHGLSKQSFVLDEQLYTVGRSQDNSIIIPSKFISRTHALLLCISESGTSQKGFKIVDGDQQGRRSLNAIAVNGTSCYSHILRNGDTISFGHTAWASYQVLSIGTSKFLNYLDYKSVQVDENSNSINNKKSNAPLKMTFTDAHLYQDLNTRIEAHEKLERQKKNREENCQTFAELGVFLDA